MPSPKTPPSSPTTSQTNRQTSPLTSSQSTPHSPAAKSKTPWSTRLAAALLRRKAINFEGSGEHGLARVLNTFDLTTLGIGCTIGSGIYVITGQVALMAGPAVLLSYVIAGFASIFAGLCYAEFGALVPRAGSAYVYSYVTVGEFMAFVIGWNLTLEYIIGTAAVARATSDYIDSLCGSLISQWFAKTLPLHAPIFSEYPDLLALGIIIVLTGRLGRSFVMIDIPNGNKTADDPTYNHGGFFPFGASGMLAGAASCFYAFAGFDVIATTGSLISIIY
ncbi:hypothetical protein HELRODRAFT_193681 [Helobdella robusta]|uniref:Amino acid permease/ SLC12A domain-containing protein n=1 Tax=Helobdella robusta TaxID=6412 RepID=T1FV91_HELRO|nr:hypothetical protein HELRODRAFT_193681 [Helobdella robusta]ESN94974.1 hypothetical protein HELRODRAFT_193681 [Helobdella robusta]